jgi:hypothetical protein
MPSPDFTPEEATWPPGTVLEHVTHPGEGAPRPGASLPVPRFQARVPETPWHEPEHAKSDFAPAPARDEAPRPSPWPELPAAPEPIRHRPAPERRWPELLSATPAAEGWSAARQELDRRARLDREQRGE